MRSFVSIAGTAAILYAASFSMAQAEDTSFYGTWRITDAVQAPWAKSAAETDPATVKALLGKTITIKPDAIEGAGQFPCKGPRYEVIEGGPDMLFQGMFGQMHGENPANDPQKLAEQVGFSGSQYKTVITGCEFAVDFSLGADPDRAKFALDNTIYTMKREEPGSDQESCRTCRRQPLPDAAPAQ
jgi:hypothetical protein